MATKMETLKNRIIEALKDHETNIDITQLLVNVVKKGSMFSTAMEVQISGRVGLRADLERIQKIVEEVADPVPVVNTLRYKS